MLAQDIIEDCEKTLQDPANARWSLDELLSWLNEGQRVIVKNKPNAFSLTTTQLLVPGTYQSMPSDAIQLLDIIRNNSTSQRVVRQTTREELDAVDPNWHTNNPNLEVDHFTYTDYEPLKFYVQPPNDGDGAVEILYSAIPPTVDDPLDPLSIPDFYRAPLVDYTLYRCFLKDSEDAANKAMAETFYGQFMTGLALLSQNEVDKPPFMG